MVSTLHAPYPLRSHVMRLADVTCGYAAAMNKAVDTGSADAQMTNGSPGDGVMEDDLTEERYPSPQERNDVADDQPQDP